MGDPVQSIVEGEEFMPTGFQQMGTNLSWLTFSKVSKGSGAYTAESKGCIQCLFVSSQIAIQEESTWWIICG